MHFLRRRFRGPQSSPARTWNFHSFQSHLITGLFLVTLGTGTILGVDPFFSDSTAEAQQRTSQNKGVKQTPIKTVKTSVLDEPLRLLWKGHQTYQKVQDYSCTMVKQERVGGKLQQEHVMDVKFRNTPFSISMKWRSPKSFEGQEVVYVHGRNKNHMRVKKAGFVGRFGFVSIDPNSALVKQHSRHTITEAGLANLIARIYRDWYRERNYNRAQVKIGEYRFNKQPCTRIEVTQTQRTKDVYCYRTVLYLDKTTRIPVRLECYDWPRQGGPAGGEVLEIYSYLNVRYNVQLTDADFNK
ncbi:MAG: DUF1571 domain-containing protein [Gemmataceae bacterium]